MITVGITMVPWRKQFLIAENNNRSIFALPSWSISTYYLQRSTRAIINVTCRLAENILDITGSIHMYVFSFLIVFLPMSLLDKSDVDLVYNHNCSSISRWNSLEQYFLSVLSCSTFFFQLILLFRLCLSLSCRAWGRGWLLENFKCHMWITILYFPICWLPLRICWGWC
jgi:hypothetical protein